MKLNYDKKSKDPTYFIQMGIRNGKKTTTKNVKRIGKHSELLAITPDPLAYAKEQVALFNQQYKEGKAELSFKIDFSEKLSFTDDIASKSTLLNPRSPLTVTPSTASLPLPESWSLTPSLVPLTSWIPITSSPLLAISISCALWIYWRPTSMTIWNICSLTAAVW